MAIAFDAGSQGDSGSATSLTVSHTCTGSDRILLVSVGTWDGVGVPVVPTVTYNAVSMTQVATLLFGSSGDQRLTMFRLVAPATGANNIVVSASSASDIVMAATSYTGVDQTTPLGTPGTDTSPSDTEVTQALTSETGDLVIDCVAWYNQSITVGSGQTARVTNDNGASLDSVAMSDEAGATSVTMSWSWTTGEWAAQIAANMNAASAGSDIALSGKGEAASAGTATLALDVALSGKGEAASAGTATLTVTASGPAVALSGKGEAASAGIAVLTFDDQDWDHATFKVEIETAVAGVWTDVTGDYVHATWHGSLRERWAANFSPGSATIQLANGSGRYLLKHPTTLIGIGRRVRISNLQDAASPSIMFVGTIKSPRGPQVPGQANVVNLDVRTALAVASQQNREAVSPVGASEYSGARVGRILDSINWPAGDRDIATGNWTLQATTLAGSALAELHLVADSTGGEIFEDNEGNVVWLGSNEEADARKAAPVMSLADSQITPAVPDTIWAGVEISADVDSVINSATFGIVGGTPITRFDTPSITEHGLKRIERTDLITVNPTKADGLAYEIVAAHKDPSERIDQIRITGGDSDAVDRILALQVLDLVDVYYYPGDSRDPAHLQTVRTQIQGIVHTITPARPTTHPGGRTDTWETVLTCDDARVL